LQLQVRTNKRPVQSKWLAVWLRLAHWPSEKKAQVLTAVLILPYRSSSGGMWLIVPGSSSSGGGGGRSQQRSIQVTKGEYVSTADSEVHYQFASSTTGQQLKKHFMKLTCD
jgi:hypothetical protein